MKRFFTICLAAMLMLALLAGCGGSNTPANSPQGSPTPANTPSPSPVAPSNTPDSPPPEPAEPVNIRLGGLKGPGGMGMVKLLDDAENGLTRNTYEYFYGNSADELTPKFLQGEFDIIGIPANMAAILYNNTAGGAKIIALTATGVMYIVEKGGEEIQTVADLKGHDMYSTGKGSTAEFAMRYLFRENGLKPDEDVSIEWIVGPTEIVASMSVKDHAIAMLPQPFVTVALTQVPDLRVALDLNAEWEALGTASQFLSAVLIVRSEFAENHPEALDIFLEEFKASTDYVNANPPEAAALIEKYGIIAAPIAERALPACNLVSTYGAEMKPIMKSYLEVIYEQEPASVGGTLPADDFYYGS